ncbi:MAG: xanthine dehydrogenase family protein subunit M [Bacteroidota bacterium]
MYLPSFNYHKPATIKEALDLLEKNSNIVLMAGGTDLLVEIKKGLRSTENIVSLSEIEALKIIEEDDKTIYVGTALTINNVITSPLIRKYLPALADAASKIGSAQVRNSGTIGGNLCTAASCCDTAPILMALNASLEIVDSNGVKTVPLKDFFIFNKKTILTEKEIVTKVIVPKPESGHGAHYEKFGLREACSISVVSAATMVLIKDNACADACVVIGAVAPTPKISIKASEILKGKKISDIAENSVLLEQAGQAATDDSIPIDDIRSGAQYRRDILKVITQRSILSALKNATKK